MIGSLPLTPDGPARVKAFVDYNLDYTEVRAQFSDLIELASGLLGGRMTVLNLVDANFVWVVKSDARELNCIDKEEAVGHFAVGQNEALELHNPGQDQCLVHLGRVRDLKLDYYYGVPLLSRSGHSIGVLCTVASNEEPLNDQQKDILQRVSNQVIKRLEDHRAVNRANDRYRSLEKERIMLAHDIRGPIAGIMGLADLAGMELKEESYHEIASYLEAIKNSGQAVLDLSDDILNLSDHSRIAVPLTLDGLAGKMERLFRPRLIDKNIVLNIRINAGRNRHFRGEQVQRIAGNILSNAIKFTPSGGRVDMELGLQDDPLNELSVKVRDSGVGMLPATLEKLKKGVSVTVKGTDGESGSGIGLQIVRDLVEENGGILLIDSELNHGSTFDVRLPVTMLEA